MCFSYVKRAWSVPPCKAKRQYLLTSQVSRYCLLALQSSVHLYLVYVLVIWWKMSELMTGSCCPMACPTRRKQWAPCVCLLPYRVDGQKYSFELYTSWAPRKHEALNQCCFNVGPASQTVAQHFNSIGSASVFVGRRSTCLSLSVHQLWIGPTWNSC